MLTIYIPSRAARDVRTQVPAGSGIVGRPADGGGVLIDFDAQAGPGCDRATWERHVLRAAEHAGNGHSPQRLQVPEHALIPVGVVDESLHLRLDTDEDVEQSISGWLAG
ncbi:MAG: hypothetical protein U5K43_05875 [Halofilum sp. (in: g-proteobacteria)]|nr:hypothetical protein [Halofilum sp. (in: g-proteobacteria)]